MRPGTCGVTVTDSNAPLRPISSRYVGTARETAGAAVTSGRVRGGAAACALSRLHAVAAVSAPSTLRVPTAENPRAAARANTRETNEAKRSLPGVICLLQRSTSSAVDYTRTTQLPVQRQSPESKDRSRLV